MAASWAGCSSLRAISTALWTTLEPCFPPTPEKPTSDNQALKKELLSKHLDKKSETLLKTQTVSLCTTCNGSGKKMCLVCDGKGNFFCGNCRGRGLIGVNVCERCDGRGTEDYISGDIDCHYCKGGYSSCEICKGTGIQE